MKTDEEIKSAIYKVFQSKGTKRITSYSKAKGFANNHEIAIVIQIMINSNISGVLFTKDPVTSNQAVMVGNFVYGLGERLVSGESNAYTFSFSRPKGKYEGPPQFRKFASKLFRYAYRLERMFGIAQDIEWALADGKIHLLQTRPITTLSAGNLDSYELNESLTGDFLWSNTNVGESMSEVVTPLTWSILRKLDESYNILPGHYLLSGNLNGRIYSNISFPISIFATFGLNTKKVIHKMKNVFGEIPDETRISIYPFSKSELIKIILSNFKVQLQRKKKAKKSLPHFIHNTSSWCVSMKHQIQKANILKQLEQLWTEDLWKHNVEAMWVALEGTSDKMQKYVQLKEKVSQLVGDEKADLILSNHGTNDHQLASLGPLLGIADIIEGRLSKEKYIEQYGHRGPQEFELAQAEMDSDPKWLEQQIEQFQASHIDISEGSGNYY
jgi:pyruvate,water dikinase